MKRPTLKNERLVVLGMAFRARKVFGSFEKRTPGLLFGLRGEGSFTANAVLARTALSFTLTLAIDELAKPLLARQTFPTVLEWLVRCISQYRHLRRKRRGKGLLCF